MRVPTKGPSAPLSPPAILAITELLAGKKLECPAHRVETFAKAERKTKHEQDELF
ncbi:MAG: hypothetical protein ACLQVM_21175 [Terriglobia bacterium]